MARLLTIQAKDAELNDVQRNVADVLNPLLAHFLAGAILTDEVTLGTSTTLVAHKLGRTPRGWAVVSPTADARVWGAPHASLGDRLLSLTASTSVTCRLVVF